MVESTIEDPHHLRSGATASIPRWSRLLKMKRRRAGTGESGVWRGQKNDTGKPSSNPKGWPDRYKEADLEERRHRKIILNDEQELWFCDNFVRTSKYTLLDFLPRFLMEEFHPRRKMANVYFLVLASLQTIRAISNTFGVPTILVPLSIVVMVDALFAILEDVARHRADAKANASPTLVLDLKARRSACRFRRVAWSDLHVGDLVLVKNRESIPADLLVIATHEPNPKVKTGICYVETKSLDGETNLKIRQAIRSTMKLVSSRKDAGALRGFVEMEHPNKLIDNFSGSIEVEGAGAGGAASREAIQPRNLLLRGCVLRNTRWVVGLVLNTGPDTKIIMSSLERTNAEVWRIVRLLSLVCLLGAVGSLVWNLSFASDHVYLHWDLSGWRVNLKEATIQFLYLFLLLGNFIPVSLYVSMTMVKSCQAFFMRQDLDMYHEESDTPAQVRTMALNEELGQVSHVFSDKTGTLTQNVMEFRKCCIGGVSYGRGVTDIGRAVAAEMGQQISQEDLDAEVMISNRPAVSHVRFYDPRMAQDLVGASGEEQRDLLQEFFVALAVCHTVIPEREAPNRNRRRRPRRQQGPGVAYDSEVDVSMSVRPVVDRSMRDESGVCTDDEGELEESKRAQGIRGGGEDEWGEEAEEEDGGKPPKLSASSPDDEALVLGAWFFGMEFRDRVDNSACVRRSGPFVREAHGRASPASPPSLLDFLDDRPDQQGPSYVDERYEILRLLDFTSARKRMSVIVRDPRGRVRILCKGADSVMIPRLAPIGAGASAFAGAVSKRREYIEAKDEGVESRKRTMTLEHMERYAREGLRTLLVASAELDQDWFFQWNKKFEAASTDLVEVDKKKRGEENDIDTLMNKVEANLRLLGCTAIEDKLQDGVGPTVRALQSAGVKVWMLTGDKEETAINIAVACQLLPPERAMARIILNMDPQTGCRDVRDMRDRLEEELRRIRDEKATKDAKGGGRASVERSRPRALVIDGQALTLAMEPMCCNLLAELSMECAAVVCCRVSPDQKREVVALVRETRPESRTLAIGDGANDVAMIQGAHIGIGISGQEGMQAVNASDFAIAQFRFLRKLMLFHGRQNYRRMSKLVVYTFYKNVLMAIPMAWYVTLNGYSGQKFYTEGGIQMYNLLFTTLPVVFLGSFDRDVTLEDTERFPGLYVLGINDVFFNFKVFWSWMAQAIAEAALITFVPVFLLKGGPGDSGSVESLFFFGGTTFTLVVLVANSKVMWLQYRWTWWAAAFVIVSILAWFAVATVINAVVDLDFDFYMIYFHLLANPTFWAVVVLCVTAIVMRDLTWKFFHRWWQPKLHHTILEVEAIGGDPIDLTSEECSDAAARGGGSSGVGARGARRTLRRTWGGSRRRVSGGIDLITVSDEPAPFSGSLEGGNSDAMEFFSTASASAVDGVGVASPTLGRFLVPEDGGGRLGQGHRRWQQQEQPPALPSNGVRVNLARRRRSFIVSPAFPGDMDVDLEVGDSKVGTGNFEAAPAATVVDRTRTDAAWSGPPTRSTEGAASMEPGLSGVIPTMSARSWSWTMPPEPTPPMMGLSGPVPVARSRSDFVKIRPPARLPPPQGGSGTRPEQPRPPSIGYALSTNELSATLESDMNLNYVGFPVKKASTFLETPRSTLGGLERLDHLDRVVARRRENGVGLMPTGYGLWKQNKKTSAGAIGPRPYREAAAGSPPGGADGSIQLSPGGNASNVTGAHLRGAGLDAMEPVGARHKLTASTSEGVTRASEGVVRLRAGGGRASTPGSRRSRSVDARMEVKGAAGTGGVRPDGYAVDRKRDSSAGEIDGAERETGSSSASAPGSSSRAADEPGHPWRGRERQGVIERLWGGFGAKARDND